MMDIIDDGFPLSPKLGGKHLLSFSAACRISSGAIEVGRVAAVGSMGKDGKVTEVDSEDFPAPCLITR